MLVVMNVTNKKETFSVDSITGKVTGQTYAAKEFLKKNFNAKWDSEEKQWTVDVEKFNSELTKYADYYKKYIEEIIETAKSNSTTETITTPIQEKQVVSKQLINKKDGFYNRITYSDGSFQDIFVG